MISLVECYKTVKGDIFGVRSDYKFSCVSKWTTSQNDILMAMCKAECRQEKTSKSEIGAVEIPVGMY